MRPAFSSTFGLRTPVGLFLGLFTLLPISMCAASPRVIDAVDFSIPASVQAHLVEIKKGTVRADRATVGMLSLPIAGVRLEPGGSLRAHVRLMPDSAAMPKLRSVSLEVTLATMPRDDGKQQVYTVRLDGKPIYRAAESDPGAGVTRSLFLDLPALKPAADIEILADPSTQVSITIASLRIYDDLAAAPSKVENRKSKMGIALLSRQAAGYSIDADEMRALAQSIPTSPYLIPQTAVLYNFCTRNAAENAKEIRRLTALAESTGIPLRITFQMHWGGSPAGVPDGAGGTFTDLPYQQITFDPDDHVDDPGLAALMGDRYDVRYGLTTPNVWGDRPWLTFNHPRLNQFRRIHLTYALMAWRAERERLVREGKGTLLPPELSTGEETVYWAQGVDDKKYTEANGGKPRAHLMADFNPFVVADALRDKVNLDPRDGLDYTERWWLHRNLARQQQRIVDWMLDALPADPIRYPQPAKPLFEDDLVRRNLYTEPYALPLFPMKSVNTYRPGLEVGYVRDGRSGGEYWSGAAMLPWLLKERERGRIALPNLECTGANDAQLIACLRATYACGARFATLYNWNHRPDITSLLRAFADSIDTPVGIEVPPATAAAAQRAASREYAAPPDAFGVNRIELYPAENAGGATTGVVAIRLRDEEDILGSDVTITTALTPTSPHSHTPIPFFLPTLVPQRPGHRYVISVEAVGAGKLPFALAADGKLAIRLTADIAMERSRSLVIEDRQDTVDLLTALQDLHSHTSQSLFAREALEEAHLQFAANRVEEAYTAAIHAEQLALPAAFDLPKPGGRLAPYWITIVCPDAGVRAVITAYGDRTASVSIRSEIAQTVTVRWGSAEITAALTPDVPAEIALDLGKAPPVTRKAAVEGKIQQGRAIKPQNR